MVSIAVVNQKGGVGKTTISVLLSRFLSTKGYRTLLVDGDPQGHATGIQLSDEVFHEDGRLKAGIPHLIELFLEKGEVTKEEASSAVFESKLPSGKVLHVIPNSIETHVVEHRLLLNQTAPFLLRSVLSSLDGRYDVCVIDCPPNMGSLFISALSAASYILIPVEASLLSLLGLKILMNSISSVKKTLNTSLKILGIVLTKTSRTRASRDIEEKIKKEAEGVVFKNTVPLSIRVQEALEKGFSFEKRTKKNEVMNRVEAFFQELLERLEASHERQSR